MKPLVLFLMALLLCPSAGAQEDAGSFRTAMIDLVEKGNREYLRSYRQGIKLYADSIERSIGRRGAAGLLGRMDSLEFTADTYKLRGDWHYENSNYDETSYAKAEDYFLRALAIYNSESAFNGLRRNAPMVHRELAQLYYKMRRYGEALEHTQVAYNAFDEQFGNEFDVGDNDYTTYLDLKTQLAICQARMGQTEEALRQIGEVVRAYPEKEGSSYHEALRKKAKIIMIAGADGCEAEALPLYKDYLEWIKQDAMQSLSTMTAAERDDYWMRVRPFVADCYQLERADPAFLYDVTLFSKGLLLQINRFSGRGKSSERAIESLQYTWRQIQRRLPAKSCAIEFVQYEKSGKQYMGALVLNSKGNPQWVQMLSPDDFMSHEQYGRTNRERLYNTEGKTKNALYNDSTFFAQLWSEELTGLIGNCERVYFAPDGYLHQVAIEYMIPEEMDGVDFYRLSSTRRLMEEARVRTDAALIVGGVQYNTDEDGGRGNDDAAYLYMKGKQANFPYLKGSLAEADSIRALRSCEGDSLLKGSLATEDAFRRLCSQFPIISISTHGYFGAAEVPQSTDLKTCQSDESMSQCVLAMAGANTSLGNPSFDAQNIDGILSAKELSATDMENADLVVVSACQTALGHVTADGVYGIQRGLKNAGAGCIVVSLWNVNDDATCLLMERFHKYLREGMTAHSAFTKARRSLMAGEEATVNVRKLKFDAGAMTSNFVETEDTYDKPEFYDAFIMIDAVE